MVQQYDFKKIISGIMNDMPDQQFYGIKRSDYATLSEYVDALNTQEQRRYEATNGGGIAGSYKHYSLIKYMRKGVECDGYKESSSSYIEVNINKKGVKYFDDQGIEITDNIKEVAGSLYYIADASDVVSNLWPLAVVIVAVAVVLITLIKNRK